MYFVVHVDTGIEWRGGQKQVFLLAHSMFVQNIPTAVACPRNSLLYKRLREIGVDCIEIPKGWSLRTVWILSRVQTQLFAAHTAHAHSCCLFFSDRLIVHRRVDFIPKTPWKYRKPRAYIAVSTAVKKIIEPFTQAPIFVVPDGVRVESSFAKALDAPTVLAVGALVEHKGHLYLSNAAKLLPNIDIGIAGEGHLRYSHVRHLGYRDDIPALMASAHMLVHPSIEEGMGQVLVEAMLAKLPIVATRVGGITETVGKHAVLVPPKDPHALAEAIQRVLAGVHPCVEEAYVYARENLSVEKMVCGTLRAYREVL